MKGLRPSPTVLIVDDERPVAAALGRSLRGEGYRILLAHDRAEAVAHLEREPVDAVLSDAAMPGLEGVSFLGELDRWCPEAARILVTAWPERVSSRRLRDAGIDTVIAKPWDLGELRGVLRLACR